MKLFIPWRFFFRCLNKQHANSREYWLTYFSFADGGVTLIPDVSITPEEIQRAPRHPLEDEEGTALSALLERKRGRTLH